MQLKHIMCYIWNFLQLILRVKIANEILENFTNRKSRQQNCENFRHFMPEDPESDMTPETSLQFEYGSTGAGQSDTVTNVANVGAVTKMAENEITNPESHSLPTTPPQKIERIDTNFNQSAMSDINQLTRKDFEKFWFHRTSSI